MTMPPKEDKELYKHTSEYKSCDNCEWTCRDNTQRYGCPWRSEILMFDDKSPCLNYEKEQA